MNQREERLREGWTWERGYGPSGWGQWGPEPGQVGEEVLGRISSSDDELNVGWRRERVSSTMVEVINSIKFCLLVFANWPPEGAREHLCQVTSLLCLEPSMALTSFKAKAKVLLEAHKVLHHQSPSPSCHHFFLFVPSFTQLHPHRPSLCSLNTFLPLGLCMGSSLRLGRSSPRHLRGSSLTSFRSLRQCFFFTRAFSGHLL